MPMSNIADTPAPPYYAVIFSSHRTEGDHGYSAMAETMVELASRQPGFLGIESAREHLGITVSYWESLEAIRNWKQHAEHREAQRLGRPDDHSVMYRGRSRHGAEIAFTTAWRSHWEQEPGKTQMQTKPKVIISSTDAERLERLLESLPRASFPGRDELEAELARAEVVEPKDVPPTVVTMNSTVRFEVESSREEFRLTLVYPRDLDASGEKISILAPVGSALLGLSQGDEIEWPKPGGGMLRVRIKEVIYQPERSGEYHR